MGDGIEFGGTNTYDPLAATLDAYRMAIEENIAILAPYEDDNGKMCSRVMTDYPDQNLVKVRPPVLNLIASLAVTRPRLGGTRKVHRVLNPDGETWTQITRVGYGRIVFTFELWAENATQRGQIHAALLGLMQPKWTLDVGDYARAVLRCQHDRPVRDGRENSVARWLYQGFILTPILVQETLYNVNEIHVGIGFLTGQNAPQPPATTNPNIVFYELPDE